MKQTSPALALHHCTGRKYELSGLRTGSLRDQILRAHQLVLALWADVSQTDPSKRFRRDLPLLIIGAGVAGLEAARTARMLGLTAHVFEARPTAYSVQGGITTRWIDPVEYDWPQAHFDKGTMDFDPFAPTRAETAFDAGMADQLALQWNIELSLICGAVPPFVSPANGSFVIHWNARIAPPEIIDTERNTVALLWSPPDDDPVPREFSAAISTVGMLTEDTTIRSATPRPVLIECPRFWDFDSMTASDLGSGRDIGDGAPNIAWALVSGGGDGAMQDVQRLLTGQMGFTLYKMLGIGVPASLGGMLEALLCEDFARRAHLWSRAGQTPLNAFSEWHEAYERMADAILTGWASDGTLPGKIALLRPGVALTWIVRPASTGYAYGLNRLLSFVLVKLHTIASGRPPGALTPGSTGFQTPVLIFGHQVAFVASADGHLCNEDCFDSQHTVFVEEVDEDGEPVAAAFALGDYDYLVARHGVRANALFGGAPVSEQIVPYDIPY